MHYPHYRTVLSSLLLLLSGLLYPSQAADKLVLSGANWKWFPGKTEASTPTNLWRTVSFDDSSWSPATTPLSYGKGETRGTVLTNMQGNFSSLFMRTHFNVASLEAADGLTIDFLSDDGFILWINGIEVLRYNVATGELPHDATADFSPDPTQLQSRIITDAHAFLKQGDNVVAVHAFNASIGSSDFILDLTLGSYQANNAPPRVIATEPAPGPVEFFDELTFEFNEAVVGVDPADIRINGRIPDGVDQLTDSKYRFYFPPPAQGRVVVSWSSSPGIVNVSNPPFSFAPERGKETLIYTLIDAQEPSVTQVHPAIGTTVARMSEVSVLFNETVQNLKGSDLLVNGIAATNVTGTGAGPYLFSLPPVAAGKATLSWAPTQVIADSASPSNLFTGGAWTVDVSPTLSRSNLVLSEFLSGNYATTGLKDEDGTLQDWIEIRNTSPGTVSLYNWALSDDPEDPAKWTFPSRLLGPGQYLVVFASGLDRRPSDPQKNLHTNFRLTRAKGYLGLFSPDSPRSEVSSAINYPDQRNQISYGRISTGEWRYLTTPTPGAPNATNDLIGIVEPVHFSDDRGIFKDPFKLHLSSPTPGATILFTTNGNDPLPGRGSEYTAPIEIQTNTLIRAAAYKTGLLPSTTRTKSFLYAATTNVLSLPVLSLVTDTNNLFGPTGILSIQGGRYVAQGNVEFWEPVDASDYHNPSKVGIAWERPASFEWIQPLSLDSFQAECGIRTHTSLGSRLTLAADSKFSFRTSFRGTYGDSKLNEPIFPNANGKVGFDNLIIRAGHFDDSNPFLNDELTRRLFLNMGHLTSHGTFAHLFLNGKHMGYYNPVERLDGNFYRLWHQSTNLFDVIVAYGESREGDQADWEALLDLARNDDLNNTGKYLAVDAMLDLDNFADYMLLNIYGDAGDWTDSNWSVYRERIPGAKFRYSVWDSEFPYGIYSRDVNNNTLIDDGELGLTTEISTLWNALRKNPDFRLRFADRLHKHMFNGGTLTDENILAEYGKLKALLLPSIPDFRTHIEKIWVPKRRSVMFNFLRDAGLYASDSAPAIKESGGRVLTGAQITFQSSQGAIYYTTDGSDPRQPFNGNVGLSATLYREGTPIIVSSDLTLKARALVNGAWSALLAVPFQVGNPQGPVQLTEIMYNPQGGDGYEFVEIRNSASIAVDLAGASFEGIDFAFPEGSLIPANGVWLIASNADPASFARRYPSLSPVGFFKGKLSNAGERLALKARNGSTLFAVEFKDNNGWPTAADGLGAALEPRNPNAPLDDVSNWIASPPGGTPGTFVASTTPAPLLINEISHNPSDPYIELRNTTEITQDLAGWSLSDDGNVPRKFVFPSGPTQKLAPGGFLVLQTATSNLTLPTSGGAVFLFNPLGARVDAITYGSFPTNYTVGRNTSRSWTLTVPSTKGATNSEARLSPVNALKLNEWLANAAPGESDWVEIFNTSDLAPVPVRGLFLQNGQSIASIPDLTFIPPRGYLQLFADENAAPNHLQLKISAQAGSIALLDTTGVVIDSASYPAQIEGASFGRSTDGGSTLVSFPTTQSPAAPNRTRPASGLIINEIMANNITGIPDPRGRFVDWIEIYNSGTTNIDGSGMRLEIGKDTLSSWSIPQGTFFPAKTYRVIWCDPASTASTTPALPYNSALGIPKEGGLVRLSDSKGSTLDLVDYGQQVRDLSIGLVANKWNLLQAPTPGAVNSQAATLGNPNTLRINEWLASSSTGSDRFELFNTGSLPVALSGLSITDSARIGAQLQFIIPDRSFLGPLAFTSWEADGDPSKGPGHAGFNLDAVGEGIYLYATNGTLLNAVSFAKQTADVSQGRIPDGADLIASFTSTTTIGTSNYSPIEGLVINEILTHTDAPFDDAIEFLNTSSQPINIGNWFLTDDSFDLKKFRIPGNETIPARGFKVLYGTVLVGGQFSSARFALDSAVGDTIILSEATPAGVLTGRRIQVEVGPAANGVSFGRIQTSQGVDYAPLSKLSFGISTPTSVEVFQTGQGELNAPPLVGPVVISEVHYSPLASLIGTNGTSVSAEFIELYNSATSTTDLFGQGHPENPWKLSGAVDFSFPPGTQLAPKELCLLVSFNPATDSQALAAFKSTYSITNTTRIFGPYKGKLSASGESLELSRPDFPQGPNDEHPGLIPYLLVEKIDYSPNSPWPTNALNSGLSIQRESTIAYANEPANWTATTPTPGALFVPSGPVDSDSDGLPDEWEIAHGLNPLTPADATLDSDSDGLSNLAEFLSGTSPTNASDKLSLSLNAINGSLSLELNAKANHSYSILVSDDVTTKSWTKLTDIPSNPSSQIVQTPLNPASTTTSSASRFYRVVTPSVP